MAIPEVDAKINGRFNHSVLIGHDGSVYRLASVDSDGNLKTRSLIWNSNTLAWENATGSLAGGQTTTVNNFPSTYPVTDNSGSLTVDAPVGTPVFMRLSDGSAAITTLPVSLAKYATATRTQVADAAADTLILAANSGRQKATVYNDSSALLYLGLGTTATTSSNYTARVYPNGYYEAPSDFTGQIRGIWATDPNDGGAKVTEITT